jgi:esterase/lipase superfamily enzyme
MELKVFGYYGKPIIAFPAQAGRFYDFENFGMVEAISKHIETGQVKLFCVDSIDHQTWANYHGDPHQRAMRHEDYDRYITSEVVPFVNQLCGGSQQGLITTGASMGGYHAGNFFFRHPDLFDTMISLSGVFQLKLFVGEYMDDNVYFNSPLHYLSDLEDPWYLEKFRQNQIIVCCGQGAWEDEMIRDAHALKEILTAKQIPHWIDFWGFDVNHDWPWWRKMLPHFLDTLGLPGYSP